MYEYVGRVIGVHDGDTLTVRVDLGFQIYHTITVRLYGINAPEVIIKGLKTQEKERLRDIALDIRDWLSEELLEKEIVLQTFKDKKEKYGRYLGIIFFQEKNINDILLANFHEIKKYK